MSEEFFDFVHICSFEAVDLTPAARKNYNEFRAAVLKAGRFSVFEATENVRMAGMYTTLSRDPSVKLTTLAYPWTKAEEA